MNRIIPLTLVLTLGYSLTGCSTVRPAILETASRVIQSKHTDDLATERPELVRDAKNEVSLAETAREHGDTEEATLRSYMALAKIRTAQHFVARGEARAVARARAESEEGSVEAQKHFEQMTAKLKALEAHSESKPSAELDHAKIAIFAARDQQAEAIKEGAPARSGKVYNEGARLIENAIESLSLAEYKFSQNSAERALASFNTAIEAARTTPPPVPTAGVAPSVAADPLAPRATHLLAKAEAARAAAVSRLEQATTELTGHELDEGDRALEKARRANAARAFEASADLASDAVRAYGGILDNTKAANLASDNAPLERARSETAHETTPALRDLVDAKLLGLQVQRIELIGQLRDETCRGPFREFEATLDLAQKRFDLHDYAHALEYVIRASERIRVCDTRNTKTPRAPVAERAIDNSNVEPKVKIASAPPKAQSKDELPFVLPGDFKQIDWKPAYEQLQAAARARDAAQPTDETRDAYRKGSDALEAGRSDYRSKKYLDAEKNAIRAKDLFATIQSQDRALEPERSRSVRPELTLRPTISLGSAPAAGPTVIVNNVAPLVAITRSSTTPAAATHEDWDVAYRRVTEALQARDRAAAVQNSEDQVGAATAAQNLAWARGAYSSQEFATATTYAEAALRDYAILIAAANARGEEIKEVAKVDSRKAEDTLREARIALELCDREQCDDRDAVALVRGKNLFSSAERNFAHDDFAYSYDLATQANRLLGEAIAAPRKSAPPPPTDPKILEHLQQNAEAALREATIREESCKTANCARFDQENTLRGTLLLKAARAAAADKPAKFAEAQKLASDAQVLLMTILEKMPKFVLPDGVTHVSLKGEQLVVAPSIEFASGTSKMVAASSSGLNELASTLRANKDVLKAVRIIGYTDNRGPAPMNKALSESRAQAVVNALANAGVPAGLITFEGRGGDAPVADNSTDAGRKINRRIEVRVELQ